MKTSYIITPLWGLSLILVYLIARTEDMGQPASTSTEFENLPTTNHEGLPTERIVYREGKNQEQIVVVKQDRDDISSFNEINGQMMDGRAINDILPGALADGGDLMAKNLQVAHVLAGLNKDNVHAALQAFEEAPRSPLNDHNFRMFMRAWGEIDGKAAAEYAFFSDDGKKVHWSGTLAMSGWGATDPEAALAYVESIDKENRSRGHILDGMVRGWATTDLKAARDYVMLDMEDRGHAHKLVEHLAHESIKQDGPGGALAWATQTVANGEDEKLNGRVMNEVAVHASRVDPFAARTWLEENIDSEYLNPRIFEEVADELTEVDPNAGAAFLDQHFDDPRVNGTVIAETVEEWARKDPSSTAAWLEQYMGHEKINGEVVHELSGEWARTDPDSAIEWVANIENDKLMARGLASVVDRWARSDPNAVGGWLNTQDRSNQVFDPAVEAYANQLAHDQPIAALSWAQQIQDDGRRERTTVRAGQAMMRHDQDAVLTWLPESGLSERAQNAILNPPKHNQRNWHRRH